MPLEQERNINSVLEWFSAQVASKSPIAPTQWVEAGEFLNVLIGTENDTLAELEQKVAQEKLRLMADSKSVAEAKMKVEATDIYKEAKKQRNKINQILEFIRLAKVHARIYQEELRA